jgi:hypothetical protein
LPDNLKQVKRDEKKQATNLNEANDNAPVSPDRFD